jgi:signal transduction histidine kinase
MKEAIAIIDQAIQQVRSISHLLHPPLLDEVGLHSALQWHLEGFSKRSGIETSLDLVPIEFPRLAPEIERAIFRIVQEALTNVFRHSGARRAWVRLNNDGDEIRATVRDNGKGIPAQIAEFRPDSIGIGISGMRQRVKEFGGDLSLSSNGDGLTLEATIPLAGSAGTSSFALPVSSQAR